MRRLSTLFPLLGAFALGGVWVACSDPGWWVQVIVGLLAVPAVGEATKWWVGYLSDGGDADAD